MFHIDRLSVCDSGEGYIVTGSDDGAIRMYNGDTAWNRAKTSIYGAGSAITAVDVTYDGNWVLATTKSHMVVIKATIKVAIVQQQDLHMFLHSFGRFCTCAYVSVHMGGCNMYPQYLAN